MAATNKEIIETVKEIVKETKPRVYDSPHQQAIANAEDDVPF